MVKKVHSKIQEKLTQLKQAKNFRAFPKPLSGIDFLSNDYLGFAQDKTLHQKTLNLFEAYNEKNGATGSRLLSGNHTLYKPTETHIAQFHNAKTATLFSNGYMANLGVLSALPQKGDYIFYDEYVHASIRDGIRLSWAKAYKFSHNNIDDLTKKIDRIATGKTVYVVTESVFSMGGNTAPIKALITLCETKNAYLIVDEAHALGVLGVQGKGLTQPFANSPALLARVYPFGKALGTQGAAVVGSNMLRDVLINFSNTLIFNTGLSPFTVAQIYTAYLSLEQCNKAMLTLQNNCLHFRKKIDTSLMAEHFITSNSAIFALLIPGNERVTQWSQMVNKAGFQVLPIKSPTVPKGKERLRFCVHAYNTKGEIDNLFNTLEDINKVF